MYDEEQYFMRISKPFVNLLFHKEFLARSREYKDVKQAKKVQIMGNLPKWIAPPLNMDKINVDAALGKTSNKGAMVVVARDANGIFLGCSVVTVEGIMDPATLECMACREALALVSDLNLHHIKVATDCLEVANSFGAIEADRSCNSAYVVST
jgi:hypothetical protein